MTSNPDLNPRPQLDWLAAPPEPQPATPGAPRVLPWVVLIVDDEPDVHTVTRLALQGIQFRGRPLELLGASSAAEALAFVQQRHDIALILLDVVMESDDAGLQLTRVIRETLGNLLVRIVLRTGQSGQVPEQRVIVEYDINDYKAKSELTSRQLFTCVIASLRAYDSLLSLERSRRGLEKVLEASMELFKIRALNDFASGLLHQVGAILGVGSEGLLFIKRDQSDELAVLAGTGTFEAADLGEVSRRHPVALAAVWRALEERSHRVDTGGMVIYVPGAGASHYVIYATPGESLAPHDLQLLTLFCERISTAVERLSLFEALRRTQTATVLALADLAEFRDDTTGEHVMRVQDITDAIMAELQRMGAYADELSPEMIEYAGLASVLHDVGKVSTPDRILHKPGPLDAEEMRIMRQHAACGGQILAKALDMSGGQGYLLYARQIAAGHHEHWDGQGYPEGLSGRAIPLAARIVAVADVFDALTHERPYKKAWPIKAALSYLMERRERQFDPLVVDALVACLAHGRPSWAPPDLPGEEPTPAA
ncbi:MAG: DUF3369 domain-containing protein [Curvibacter sp.]|nr:MAG: DUF3369 domain-containing protein [Curvibacter sp.]